ncbi:MAG: ABC transporter permease [Bacillota bacterium]|nr:ABC transporter permease [Bacillota bacterium]
MFLLLGFVNAWRNLSRSAVALIGVALAAAVFTTSLSLAAGYPAGAQAEYRFVLGGDVLVLPARYWFADRGGALELAKADADLAFPLAYFYPGSFTRGFLAPPGMPGIVDTVDLARELGLGAAAGAGAGRAARGERTARVGQEVVPYWLLPARIIRQVMTPEGRTVQMGVPVALRGREVAKDLVWWPCQEMVLEGRYFTLEDEGQPVAVVFAGAGRLGETLTVRVPALRREGAEVRGDDRGSREFPLQVVGVLRLPRRLVTVSRGGDRPVTVPVSWQPGEIFVPARTLAGIYRHMTGEELDWAPAASVRLTSVAYLENVTSRLNRVDPRWVARSVPRLLAEAGSEGLVLPEEWRRGLSGFAYGGGQGFSALARGTPAPPPPPQPVLPVDPGGAGMYLMYAVAGMLVAVNMLVLVSGRQEEMGVLRALGARGHEILAMVLGECLAISLVGSGVAFGFIQLLATWNLVSNRVPLVQVAASTLDHLGRVLGLAALMAVVFGLIPAGRALRRSPVDLLKGL